MRNKNKNVLGKFILPFFVVAVVAGSFTVDWNRFGRAPVSYYGMGAIPMFASCKIDNALLPKKKPHGEKELAAKKKIDAKKKSRKASAVKDIDA